MKKFSGILFFACFVLAACSSQPSRITSPDDFDQAKAAKTRISLGLTYLKNGNYSQAKFNLDKALQFAPRSADAHFSLAYYYQMVEEFEAAEKAFQKAMDIEPKNADIANSYGAFLCQRGKYQEAKRYFLRAVNSDNYISSAETYENLALCSQSHGEKEDAVEYLRSAVNHQPGRAKSLYMLTQALVEANKWEEAKDTLRRFEKVSQVSANSLLLAANIEQALGNTQLAKGYGDMLLKMYPSDPAASQYRRNSKSEADVSTPSVRISNKKPVIEAPKTVVEQLVPTIKSNAQPVVAEIVQKTELSEEENPELLSEIANADLKQTNKDDSETTVEAQEEGGAEQTETLPTFHVVQAEENLYRISLLYNIRMQRLIEWNNLSDASAIYVGKKLLIAAPEQEE
jgi:type IV pilus assembly protein PilF